MIRSGRTYNYLLLLAGVLFFSSVLGFRGEDQKRSRFTAIGLVYHRFGDDRYPSTNTQIDVFEQQIKYLKSQHFLFSKASAVNLAANKFPNKKQVVITIDDGYRSFYTDGFPVLKKYQVPATLFINTESVGWKDYLTWEQIKQLAKAGIEIGNHSHSHAYFMNLPSSIREQQFEEDLLKAEKLFKEHLGFIPKVYSYPYGEYDAGMIGILKKHGYTIAFAQNSGVWSEQSNLMGIPRFPMASERMERFKSKVGMETINFDTQAGFPIVVNGDGVVEFSLGLNTFDCHSFNCFIAGHPNSKAVTVVGSKLLVSFKAPVNRRRTLVTLTYCDDDGQWHWWSRLLINPEVKE